MDTLMKFFFKLILILIFLIITALCVFLYLGYKDASKKIKIEPFGIEMGVRDTSYIIENAYENKIVSSYAINTPISKKVYKRLNPSGHCIEHFGNKLLLNSYEYYLNKIRKPLKLSYPFTDKVVYKVSIHPIIGIYSIVATIDSKKPKEFMGDKTSWKFSMHRIIGKEVLPLLRNKYETSLNSFFNRNEFQFSSDRTDEKNKHITISYKPNYRYNNKTGVDIIYNWQHQGYLDNINTPEWKSFFKCRDEIQLIKDQQKNELEQEKIKKELEKKIQKKNNQKKNKDNL